MRVPDFATHYYLPGRKPFQNLSDLSEEAVLAVMSDLNEMRRQGVQHRPFGRGYIAWRRLTETRLREVFLASGGQPERAAPHYFCLGTSTWFEGLALGMRSLSLPLSDLPPEQTSFTLVDSFSAMGFGPQFGYPATAVPERAAVYPISRLERVLERYGMPDVTPRADYTSFADELVESFVEVQLWTDAPVQHFLDPET
ncbi:MAG: hypothetical protein JWO22_2783 [Frankiales bacterium]|nr:hypothetical protein [Frankiales bacterium]